MRQRNLDNLSKLVRDLDLNVSTRWRAAHEIILGAPGFRQNPELQKVETIDILTVWDDYSRQLEQEHETETKRLRIERVRKARKAREGFVALLHELKHDGTLTRQSKWKELYPKIRKDERYENLLGLQGSSPLDLWMDIVDDMRDEVERGAEKVEQYLKQQQKVVEIETKREEFEQWISDLAMEPKLKKDVYDFVSWSSTSKEEMLTTDARRTGPASSRRNQAGRAKETS
jgi:pre-mRNA-processing factor 40